MPRLDDIQRQDDLTVDSDVFIIGGGINGCGIARDAAGRGLRVTLAEMNDLASATSSASTKLFHGGLRYLEYFEFRLVREALAEREILLGAMPHVSWPLRFILPVHSDLRFDNETPAARLLNRLLPWMKGRRPAWFIRVGLLLYDHMAGRNLLPGTRSLRLRDSPEGVPLDGRFTRAFEYSDCWIDDARLVVLNARDAAERGARIMTGTRVTAAFRGDDHWEINTTGEDGRISTHRARTVVNASGPWVSQVAHDILGVRSIEKLRLVRGSHIVVRQLYGHDKCYILQGEDGRVVFTIPYEQDFTLIGTTDESHADVDVPPHCSDDETDYLLASVSRFFKRPTMRDDIVWSYSGVRPLYDDGLRSAAATTRDYVLRLDGSGAPVLNVYGGKITTYRRLAEAALATVKPFFPSMGDPWTAHAPLPGGAFPVDGVDAIVRDLQRTHPFLDRAWALRLVRAYGTDASLMLAGAISRGDLGEDFGETITARELDWTIRNEWVRTAEDYLWRRSKLGLRTNPRQVDRIRQFLKTAKDEETQGSPEFSKTEMKDQAN
ncbi:MAG: glycerol-3-phosphate dehydrogenase [Paracoccaceae bacterium]|nr:glycerol-3-phosphate dehydrogenase [Paracoccaceae bacterium]